ncbi:MAG: hypothetical protein ACOYVK_09755 [Bacillota bacterium]
MVPEYDNSFAYSFNKAVLSEDQMKEIDTYMQAYANVPDQYILRDIMRVKSQVTPDILNQHIKNLDHLSQMEGFVTEDTKERIDRVKRILTRTSGRSSKIQQSNPESQIFFGGAGLLLWFLLLTAIWRTPYYGYPWGFGCC